MRLIDADALMELYELGEELKNYEKVLSVPIPVIQQNIKDMPTIDAVEVVRCGECEHFAEYKGKDSGKPCGYGQCKRPTGFIGIVFSDDFCSYGERRDIDGNL